MKLEKVLTVDCNNLGKSDYLGITHNDDSSERTLQYLSLVEAFTTDVVKQFFPRVRTDYIYGDICATLFTDETKGIKVLMDDEEGKQKTKVSYDEIQKDDVDGLITKLESLYAVFNRLQEPIEETKSFDFDNAMIFNYEYHSLTISRDRKSICFSNKSRGFTKYFLV